MRPQHNVLSLVAFVFAAPPVALIVRRAFVLATSGGRGVGADAVLAAYGCVIASIAVALVAARRNHEPLGKASVYATSLVLAVLLVANAVGVFEVVWW